MRRRSIGARHGMKKLDALIARFADDVIRTVRAATLGELAELLASREAGTARIALPFPLTVRPALPAARSRDLHAADWLRKRGSEVSGAELAEVAEITDPERLLRVDDRSQASPRRAQRLAASIPDAFSAGRERPAGDPPDTSADRGSGGNGTASTALPMPGSPTDEGTSSQLLSEPNGEPPPPSAPQPTATVMLRANEALVRSSGAGIVIRRSKRA
jgi:hypothetical protein